MGREVNNNNKNVQRCLDGQDAGEKFSVRSLLVVTKPLVVMRLSGFSVSEVISFSGRQKSHGRK